MIVTGLQGWAPESMHRSLVHSGEVVQKVAIMSLQLKQLRRKRVKFLLYTVSEFTYFKFTTLHCISIFKHRLNSVQENMILCLVFWFSDMLLSK